MALVRHSFITATAANWVYTMDTEGFLKHIKQLAALPLGECETANCVLRIAKQTVAHDMSATERQWRELQTNFTFASK